MEWTREGREPSPKFYNWNNMNHKKPKEKIPIELTKEIKNSLNVTANW